MMWMSVKKGPLSTGNVMNAHVVHFAHILLYLVVLPLQRLGLR